MVDLQQRLRDEYPDVHTCDQAPGWWLLEVRTPAWAFDNRFLFVQDRVFVVSVRCVPEDASTRLRTSVVFGVLNQIREFLTGGGGGVADSSGLTKVRVPRLAPFDGVLLVNATIDGGWAEMGEEFAQKSVSVYPVYWCEFRGDEDASVFELMRRRTVSLLDWSRRPSPRIDMMFQNPATRSGSAGKYIPCDLERVEDELRRLSAGAFVELRNLSGDRWRADGCKSGGCKVLGGTEVLTVARCIESAVEFVRASW